MGRPITRLNPKIESSIQKTFLEKAIELLLSIAMILPKQDIIKRGPKPYDYRKVIVICVLRVLLRKTYADYEIEMRNDKRICDPLGFKILPGKSSIQRGMNNLKMDLLREFNRLLIQKWINRKLDILIDASGIRIVGRSIWYSIRIKKRVSRRECDKVHLAVCKDTLLALNWFITEGKKNDCPFFTRLLAPIQFLGSVLADAGYLSRKNYQHAADKGGCAFIAFKKNSTAKTKSSPAWKWAFHLWKAVPMLFKNIYNQRSKVEAVFSVLKKRYGDRLHNRGAYRRRREFALRLLAYNVKLIICLQYARENNLSCWVRAKQ
tara:strand:+ start:82 stop:1041 length:960 start_codon:yes stop_codon:yes gene_type:complete